METTATTETLYELYRQHPVVTTDSRKCPRGSLFFALKGEKFDGNDFATQTLAAGCAYAVVDRPELAAADPRMILVEDTLRALQQLAAYHRRQLSIPVIGITGTNGKTTTKELTAAVLSRRFRVHYTQGNLNNQIGVPLTLLSLQPDCQLAIIEMGASHPGDIRELVEIAQPDYGIITNVGKAHLEGFGSFEGVMRTKAELYDFLHEHGGRAFINAGNAWLRQIAVGHLGRDGCRQSITYTTQISPEAPGGVSSQAVEEGCFPAACIVGHVLQSEPRLCLRWQATTSRQTHELPTRLIGSYNLENVLAAVCIGRHFGVPAEDIDAAIAAYQPSNNRSQWQQTARNVLIIDAYNANPTSMNAALDNFLSSGQPHKVVILGGMRELGSYSQAEHEALLGRLAGADIEQAWLIGPEFARAAANVASPSARFFAATEDCQAYLQTHPLTGCTILLKGSRSNRLEELLPGLS
ncbi:MAG: UDP-N-acetylmuramoyl-tripeptide--D-alanyl-D-alanine ligase [Bacteroidales bacterium]|nr:UDP-N-acetylmuramoyl-tripeptide--D-alanyl-D-alanine ligase [Bacteroidales bacterium]